MLFLALAAIGVVLHLLAGSPDFDTAPRLLLAVPLLFLLWEAHRVITGPVDDTLPLCAFGLFTYYGGFGFPVFLQSRFHDKEGVVHFTDEIRLLGATAVAVGACALYASMRLGERIGQRSTFLRRIMPPEPSEQSYRSGVLAYAFVALAVNAIPLPVVITQAATQVFSLFLAFGFLGTRPDLLRSRSNRLVAGALLLLGGARGFLAGMLEPIYRFGSVGFVLRWRYLHRTNLRLVVALGALFFILQPVKAAYRRDAWHARGEVSVVSRLDAWGRALNDFWIEPSHRDKSDQVSGATGRLCELDAVNHAFMVVPSRVPFAYGEDWLAIPFRWVPRFLWPDKPIGGFEFLYAVKFGRESEADARAGTAILLPLLVDGYWNFGWAGIGLAAGLVGLWMGFAQGAFRGNWALRAVAVAQLSNINLVAAFQTTYGALFQNLAGSIAACWVMHYFAKFASRRAAAPRLKPLVDPGLRVT